MDLVTDTWALYIYEKDTWTWTYIEIWYQSNDWTYYLNKQNLIDVFITFTLVNLCLFTLFALTIKVFNKWKK